MTCGMRHFGERGRAGMCGEKENAEAYARWRYESRVKVVVGGLTTPETSGLA